MRSHVSLLTGLAAVAVSPLFVVATPAPATAAACTTTVTGPHQGTLRLSGPGTTCLVGADQVGAVSVSGGHGLSVVGSRITGSVTSTSTAPFTFCGSSTVRGALKITGSGTLVSIGDGGLCGPSTIDGAVTLSGNTQGVQLSGNTIGGAVTARSNQVVSTIAANRIGGKLTCSDNAPAPVNDGKPNTVAGSRVGQTCAAPAF